MLYIHKRSPTPIDHWPVRRHGGANNLGESVAGKYLLLWNVDIVHREGAWHYIFEFDVRTSLNISELGRLLSKEKSYPDDMDWKSWLGPNYTIISAAVRAEILNMPKDIASTGPRITSFHQAGSIFEFGFTATPGASFTALAATNVSLALSNWAVLGPLTEFSPGLFQFTDTQAPNHSNRFYRVRSP
jgi:hypothetical protein